MTNVTHSPARDNDAFTIDGPELPLIMPGKYDASFDHYITKRMFGKAPKIVLYFKIISMCDAFEICLPRYYNVRSISGKPRRSGKFNVGRKSDFLREYHNLFDVPNLRLDRHPMNVFKGKIIEVKVKTVTKSAGQHKIPKPLQYSVIEELIRVKQL